MEFHRIFFKCFLIPYIQLLRKLMIIKFTIVKLTSQKP